MGLFNIFKRTAPPREADYYMPMYGGGGLINVSESNLLKNPTVISCINLISRSISLLPLTLYNKSNRGSMKAGWHPLYPLLKYTPNAEEPISVFLEKVMRDILTYGNAFIWISRINGNIDALYSLDAKEVTVYRDQNTNQKKYDYLSKSYTSREILHIPGAAYDGTKGYSPASFAAKAIEMGVSLDEYARAAFDNGPNTKLLLDVSERFDRGAKPEEIKKVADYVSRTYSGKDNANKPFILFDKMKATPVDITSNKDAELLEARIYQEKTIAQMFQVPLFLLGKGEVTYGNYDSAMNAYLTFTLGPWIKRLEQYFALLLQPSERDGYYVEFNPAYLLRTDLASKTESYSKMLRIGVYSIDEIREKENLPPLEDEVAGTTHFGEANLMPLNKETIKAYMANQKAKMQESQGQPALDKKI